MSRTTRRKLAYLLVLVGAVACTLWSLRASDASPAAMLLVAVLLLLPGRIQGHYYRAFFRGRRLMGAGRYAEAIPHFEQFLATIRARPRLKRLVWLSWGMYTRDIEVMTLNNLGAGLLELGRLDAAERHLRSAIGLDPESPMPWHNLGLLESRRGNAELAARAPDEARRLGFRGDVSDALVRAGGSALAKLEGRPISRDAAGADV